MFNLFNRSSDQHPMDVKLVREHILQFIKEELQKSEGGEGAHIHTLKIFAAPAATEKHLYEAAVYVAEPDRLKKEIQRIADNFSVNLPKDWVLETHLQDELPDEGIRYKELPLVLAIESEVVEAPQAPVVHNSARIVVIAGRAEAHEYMITSADGRVNMGREKTATTSGGGMRTNHIVFPDDPEFPGNRFVSRIHAHLEWNQKRGGFMLFADEGGVPPGNKTKVQPMGEEGQFKLNSAQVGHFLQDGDQLILGESVVLQFNYLT